MSDTPWTDKHEFEVMGVGAEGDPTYRTFKAVDSEDTRKLELELVAVKADLAECDRDRENWIYILRAELAKYEQAELPDFDEIISHVLDESLQPRNRLQGVIARLGKCRADENAGDAERYQHLDRNWYVAVDLINKVLHGNKGKMQQISEAVTAAIDASRNNNPCG